MIGGHDLIYDIDIKTDQALDMVFSTTRHLWPNCVVEDAETGNSINSPELHGLSEIMIFKNQASRDMWGVKGAVSETEDTMIYALARDKQLTLAVCDPNKGDVKTITDSVKSLLTDPLFH